MPPNRRSSVSTLIAARAAGLVVAGQRGRVGDRGERALARADALDLGDHLDAVAAQRGARRRGAAGRAAASSLRSSSGTQGLALGEVGADAVQDVVEHAHSGPLRRSCTPLGMSGYLARSARRTGRRPGPSRQVGQRDAEPRAALRRVPGRRAAAEPGREPADQREAEAGPHLAHPAVALVQRGRGRTPRAGRRPGSAPARRRAPRPPRHRDRGRGREHERRPAGVTRSAFSASLSRICRTRTGSVRTSSGAGGTRTCSGTPARSHRCRPDLARLRDQRRQVDVADVDPEVLGTAAGRGRAGRRRAGRAAGPRPAWSRRSRDVRRRHDPVGQRLGVALDRRQRGPQLVRDREQELALPALAGRPAPRSAR